MKSKLKLFVPILMLLVVCTVHAQQNQTHILHPAELMQKPQGFLHNLIDPNKFHMSQSYTLSMFSIGNQTYNQGLYLNTMSFRFSDPLMMQVRLGVLHQPFGQFGNQQGNTGGGQAFVQGATLQYKPFDNMRIILDYQTYPGGMRPSYFGTGGYRRASLFDE